MTDQNLALLVVLDKSSRTNLETKSGPDVYAHRLQHLEVLYRIVVMSSRYTQFKQQNAPLPKSPRRFRLTSSGFG